MVFADEAMIVRSALALGAKSVAGWSDDEHTLARRCGKGAVAPARSLREQIRAGEDPLGDAFCRLRSPAQRRRLGATYTPPNIVDAMVNWARDRSPARVVDPGTGSARFLMRAAAAFADAKLVGFEIDPLAAIVARANLAAIGATRRSEIQLLDYRAAKLPAIDAETLFIGNPPYVRHHDIEPRWKDWLKKVAARHGIKASALAGLHVHFFFATAELARAGDCGVFVTAAEWLSVNYGSSLRALLLNGMGVESVAILDPRAHAFSDAATTACITAFRAGRSPSAVHIRSVNCPESIGEIGSGRAVAPTVLAQSSRWGDAGRHAPDDHSGLVELGDLFRVHRGQVTGGNRVWTVGEQTPPLPARFLFPCVTRAKELFAAGAALRDASVLKRVIDLPVDLTTLARTERDAVERFLRYARGRGADSGYIASHRPAWWSVGLREPAPIVATYMARRPPAFVRNLCGARLLNIAHGIYPRFSMPSHLLDQYAAYLNRSVGLASGRTYAGGLTKFEPREMERLRVPPPSRLSVESA